MSWIWRFLKSMPLVFHVFIAVAVMVYVVAVMVVAVMVCGRHCTGPTMWHRENGHRLSCSTWLMIMKIEEENSDDGHCDERSHPTHDKHDTDTKHCSNQAQPHWVILECRPPAYSAIHIHIHQWEWENTKYTVNNVITARKKRISKFKYYCKQYGR